MPKPQRKKQSTFFTEKAREERFNRFLEQARRFNWKGIAVQAALQTDEGKTEAFYPFVNLLTVPFLEQDEFVAAVIQAGEENHVEVMNNDLNLYAVADPFEDISAEDLNAYEHARHATQSSI